MSEKLQSSFDSQNKDNLTAVLFPKQLKHKLLNTKYYFIKVSCGISSKHGSIIDITKE